MLLRAAFLVLLLKTLLPAAAAGPAITSEAADHDAEVMTLSVGEELDRFDYVAVDQRGSGGFVYTVETSAGIVGRLDVRSGVWKSVTGDPWPAANQLNRPKGICMMPHGRLAVADAGNSCIRQIDPATGKVTTLAGRCGLTGFADGPASGALFSAGLKSIVCLDNCSVLVADVSDGRLREIVVQDPTCLSAARQQHGTLATGARLLWLLAGAVMACSAQLGWIGARRYVAKHAAAAGQHMERVRSHHTVEAGDAQGGWLRAVYTAAADRFHLGSTVHSHGTHVAADEGDATLLASEEEGEEEQQQRGSMPSVSDVPPLIRLDSSAGPASQASLPEEQAEEASLAEGDLPLRQPTPEAASPPVELPAAEQPADRHASAALDPFADLSPFS